MLVLKGMVAECPACQGQDLEQLISGFAVSSESIRQSNLQAARRRYAASSDVKDKKVAEIEEIREQPFVASLKTLHALKGSAGMVGASRLAAVL